MNDEEQGRFSLRLWLRFIYPARVSTPHPSKPNKKRDASINDTSPWDI